MRLNSVPDLSTDTLVYDFANSHPAAAKIGKIEAYRLCRLSFDVQKLVPLSGTFEDLTFVIKLQNPSSFKGKTPNIIITKHCNGVHVPFADIRFNPGVHGTTVRYAATAYAQLLSTKRADDSSQTCVIGEEQHTWRPLGPSQLVLELVNAAAKRVALFTHPESFLTLKQQLPWQKEQELGELHILRHADMAPKVVDEIIGSAIAVTSQARRRASI